MKKLIVCVLMGFSLLGCSVLDQDNLLDSTLTNVSDNDLKVSIYSKNENVGFVVYGSVLDFDDKWVKYFGSLEGSGYGSEHTGLLLRSSIIRVEIRSPK